MDILIQAIGIVAMIFNILSYQFKKARQIIFMQLIAAVLFSINFYMLGAITGALLNVFAVLRAVFLLFVKKPPKFTLFIFIPIIVGMYALTFTVFKMEPTIENLIIELLPMVAQVVQTFVFFFCDAKKIRYFSYITSPLWLTYNSIRFSIGGILCESFALISITVGIIRYRKKKAK